MQELERQLFQKVHLPDDHTKLIEIETTESVESFRWLVTQLIQVATVLAIANLTVVGYASANNQAGLFILGAVITIILFVAYSGGMSGVIPILCRLISIEETASSLFNRRLETSISLTLLGVLGPEFLIEIQRVNTLSNLGDKHRAMGTIRKRMLIHYSTRTGTLILLLAILAQISAVPILIFIFKWKFL